MEFGQNLIRDLRVELCELAPVRSGMLVMHVVIPVVEQQKVQQWARERTRMIVLRKSIGMRVLIIVEQHNRPQREECWHAEREHPHVDSCSYAVNGDAQRQHPEVCAGPDDVLKNDAPIERPIGLFGALDVGANLKALPIRGHEKIRGGYEHVVAIGVSPGFGCVLVGIDVLVVIQIVGRYPREGRISVEDRDPIREDRVGALALERGAVVVVVRDHAAREREITTQPGKVGNPRWLNVLDAYDGCGEKSPQDGAVIRRISKFHVRPSLPLAARQARPPADGPAHPSRIWPKERQLTCSGCEVCCEHHLANSAETLLPLSVLAGACSDVPAVHGEHASGGSFGLRERDECTSHVVHGNFLP